MTEGEFKLEGENLENARQRVKEDLAYYRKVLMFMESNVPIQVLCLPSQIENVLLAQGCLRVYDLIHRDLAEIKGIGKSRMSLLTARLDEFFTVSI